MRPAQRLRLAGVAVAAAEAALGVLAIGTVLAPYFWACAAATLAVAAAAGGLLEPPPPRPRGDDRGGEPPTPPRPLPPDPEWWADFERALQEHSQASHDPAARC